jgi:hypothetical protein
MYAFDDQQINTDLYQQQCGSNATLGNATAAMAATNEGTASTPGSYDGTYGTPARRMVAHHTVQTAPAGVAAYDRDDRVIKELAQQQQQQQGDSMWASWLHAAAAAVPLLARSYWPWTDIVRLHSMNVQQRHLLQQSKLPAPRPLERPDVSAAARAAPKTRRQMLKQKLLQLVAGRMRLPPERSCDQLPVGEDVVPIPVMPVEAFSHMQGVLQQSYQAFEHVRQQLHL